MMDHAFVMDHGLTQGMFWGSLLMMAVPILLGLGIGVYVLRRHLEDRRRGAADRGDPGAPPEDGGNEPPRLPVPEVNGRRGRPARRPQPVGGPSETG